MNLDDAQELAALWASAQDDVAIFIRAFIRNADDANDVLQQVAMKVVRKFEHYDQSRPFGPWAIAVAKRECLTHLRRRTADRHVFSDEIISQVADEIERRLGDEDSYHTALRICVDKADPRGKQALQLYYGKEMKTAQIADELSMSPGAVRMLLCRAREAVRKCIETRLGSV